MGRKRGELEHFAYRRPFRLSNGRLADAVTFVVARRFIGFGYVGFGLVVLLVLVELVRIDILTVLEVVVLIAELVFFKSAIVVEAVFMLFFVDVVLTV